MLFDAHKRSLIGSEEQEPSTLIFGLTRGEKDGKETLY